MEFKTGRVSVKENGREQELHINRFFIWFLDNNFTCVH